ncbi:MAG: hypothetical protein IPQ22_07555 [Rhodoferax sp.]|nr:hypothetical protein [Rhodoferax sp.]
MDLTIGKAIHNENSNKFLVRSGFCDELMEAIPNAPKKSKFPFWESRKKAPCLVDLEWMTLPLTATGLLPTVTFKRLGYQMPAGDAQRTWFPELIDLLRRNWNPSMSMLQLIELRNQLDGMLQTIRTEHSILPPLMTCSHCGIKSRAARHKVSVRAMIFALSRFRIASLDEVHALEKLWDRYRRDEHLDLYGDIEVDSR